MQTYAREKDIPLAFVDGIRPDLTPDRILYAIKEGLAASETLSDVFDNFEREYQDYLIVQQVLQQGGGLQAMFDVVGNVKDSVGLAQVVAGLGQALTERVQRTISNRFALERYLRGVERTLTSSLKDGLEAAVQKAPRPLALLVDTYEELEGLDDWVCRTLVPALPEGVKVVVLGRNALPKVNFDWGEFGESLRAMELPELWRPRPKPTSSIMACATRLPWTRYTVSPAATRCCWCWSCICGAKQAAGTKSARWNTRQTASVWQASC
jgi:hypothetical protein